MNNLKDTIILPDEKLMQVNGGDGGAIYGKDIDVNPDLQTVEITFTKAPQGSNGGAVYYGSHEPQPQQFREITFVSNNAGQSGGAIVTK